MHRVGLAYSTHLKLFMQGGTPSDVVSKHYGMLGPFDGSELKQRCMCSAAEMSCFKILGQHTTTMKHGLHTSFKSTTSASYAVAS